MEWTHQWKQEGLEEGRQEGLHKGLQKGQEDALEKARGVLVRDLERRFGLLPDEVRRRVDAIASIEELTEFVFQAGAATTLDTLG